MSADNNKQTGDLNTKCKRRPGLLENIHLIIIIGSKLYEIIDTCSQTDKKQGLNQDLFFQHRRDKTHRIITHKDSPRR